MLGLAGVFAVSWATTQAYLRWARRHQILDHPNDRSSHRIPTPRGGGVGIVAAVALTALGLGWLGGSAAVLPVVAVALGTVVAAVSWLDDLREVRALVRLGVHIVSAGAFATVWHFVTPVPLASAGSDGWLTILLLMLWIAAHINFYNFMDGIDGIAASQAAVVGCGWACAGYVTASPGLSLFGAGVAVACLAFLCFNWSPARIFMGDVGSAFLGFIVGAIPLFAGPLPLQDAIVFGALASGPFLCDASVTLVQRALRRENLLKAHRTHQYQILVRAGWTHQRVTLIYCGWAILTVLAGIAWLTRASGKEYLALAALIIPEVSLAILANSRRKEMDRNNAS